MPRKKKKKTYSDHRDDFFVNHPNAKPLLGLLIVSIAFFVGVLYKNLRIHEEVAKYLWETEQIEYDPNL